MKIDPERAKVRLSEVERGIAEAELLHGEYQDQADTHWARRGRLLQEKELIEKALAEAGVFGYAPKGGDQ